MSKKESNPQPPSESVKPQPPPPPPKTEDHWETCVDPYCKGCGNDKARKQDYQDVLVKECRYCPFHYYGANRCIVVGHAGKDIAGESRDDNNFPKFCPLADKAILIRRNNGQ